MKRSVAQSVPDKASVHTRSAGFEAVSAPEQYCSAPVLKVERSVSNRFFEIVRIKSQHFYYHNRTLIPVHILPEQLLKRSKNLSSTV